MRGQKCSLTSLVSLIEQILEWCLIYLGETENLQELIGQAFQTHIMLNEGHKTVGNDGCTNLCTKRILSCSPELFDSTFSTPPPISQLSA